MPASFKSRPHLQGAFRPARSKGFTLLELMLVLAAIVILTTLAFAGQVRDRDLAVARATGQQLRNVGNALNEYISTYHDSLVNAVSAPNSTDDGGPRVCDTGSNLCTININTLINSGSLPPGFKGITPYQSAYVIKIKRRPIGGTGTFSLDGLVYTALPWITGGAIPRYDLLGAAIQQAGADAGMSRASSTQIDGYNGMWSALQSDFSPSTAWVPGLLGYRAGYSSNSYGSFLRRDGSLEMEGALNMGTTANPHSIYNVKDIFASGGIQAQSMYVNGGVIQLGPDASNTIFKNAKAGTNQTVLAQDGGVLIVTAAGAPADLAAVNNIRAQGDITTNGNILMKGILQVQNSVGTTPGKGISLYNNGDLGNTGMIYSDRIQIAKDNGGNGTSDTYAAPRFSVYGSGQFAESLSVYKDLYANSFKPVSGNTVVFDTIDGTGANVVIKQNLYLQGGLFLNKVVTGSASTACTTDFRGAVARTPSGGLIICDDTGRWKPTAILTSVVRYGTPTADVSTQSSVYCNPGSFATGGGARRTGIRVGATNPPPSPISATPIPPSGLANSTTYQGGYEVTAGTADSYFTPFVNCAVVAD